MCNRKEEREIQTERQRHENNTYILACDHLGKPERNFPDLDSNHNFT